MFERCDKSKIICGGSNYFSLVVGLDGRESSANDLRIGSYEITAPQVDHIAVYRRDDIGMLAGDSI